MSGSGDSDVASAIEKLAVTETEVGSKVKNLFFQPCGNCGKACSRNCGNCRKESYCSVICQKARRKEHKLICFPATEEVGVGFRARGCGPRSFWIATRDIPEGETVFTDYPLMIGPGIEGEDREQHICIGCHDSLKNFVVRTDLRKCGKCKWPLCGLSCSGIQRHFKDCETLCWMRENNSEFEIVGHAGSLTYYAIRQIRLFSLIKNDPIKWKSFKSLYVPPSELNNAMKKLTVDIKGFEGCVRFFKNACQLEELTNETMFQLAAAEQFYRCPPYNSSENKAELLIYDKETRMDISCCENCYVQGIPISENKKKDPHGITIVAARPIQKGQRLTMTFESGTKWDGTKRRRQTLMKNQANVGEIGFICKCERCVDPTELGTNVSAVKCTKCISGHLLPINPLDDNSMWKCDTTGCSGLFPASDIDKMVDRIQKKADALAQLAFARESGQSGKNGFGRFGSRFFLMDPVQRFVEKYEKILHPHHYILLNVQELIISMHTFMLHQTVRPGKPTSLGLRDKISVNRCTARMYFEVGRKLFPALSDRQLNAHFFMGMSNFFSAQLSVQDEEDFDIVLNWIAEGLKHRRILMDFNLKNCLPLGFPVDAYEEFELLIREAYENAVDLCRKTPNYSEIPEKIRELDQTGNL